MNLRLLLEDFLGLMREEGELDVYLPLLLSAMGHEIVYRAQKGVRQYGVDIVSVGVDDDRAKKLFLWLVKCGDIGRTEWDTGPQAIRPSINDVGDVYLQSHIAPQHSKLKKKLVVLTNGDFRPTLTHSLTIFLANWAKQHCVEADMVNGSTLAAWTEKHLLDENVLQPDSKALFRRMLANVSSPEICVQVGRSFFQSLVATGTTPAKTAGARRKKQLGSLRAMRTALSVLFSWGQNEGNLLAPYRLSEFAILAVWAGFQDELIGLNKEVATEFSELLFQMLSIGSSYHSKLEPYYSVQNAFSAILPDNLLVTDTAFKELGRLALHGCIWSSFGIQSEDPFTIQQAHTHSARLVALLSSHPCTQSPCYDHQAVDIHVAMLCLLATNRVNVAKNWLGHIIGRLGQVARAKKFWPLSTRFEDALAIRHGFEEVSDEALSTSTLIPVLALWAAALKMTDAYDFIRAKVIPAMPAATMNVWSSDVGFDNAVADPYELSRHGVGEALLELPADPAIFLSDLALPLVGVQSIEDSQWYQFQATYIPLLAALHWNLQIPREMLSKHTAALTSVISP